MFTMITCGVSTLISITIMHRLKRKSGHLQLLLWMNYFHLIHDISIFPINVNLGSNSLLYAALFVGISGGVSEAAMNVWIAYVAWYIVVYKKVFHVAPNFYWIIASAIIPALTCGIFTLYCGLGGNCLYTAIVDTYDNVRLGFIGINFLLIFMIMYKLELFSCTSRKNKTEQELAIRTVAIRLIPYPTVLVIARFVVSWYNIRFGESRGFDNLTTEKYICLLFVTIVASIVSVSYLTILLVTQPHAYEHFKALLRCERYHGDENDDTSSNSFAVDNSLSRKESSLDDRDSLSFSLRDSRTEEQLMMLVEEECAITHESMFAPPKLSHDGTNAGISLTDINNPVFLYHNSKR